MQTPSHLAYLREKLVAGSHGLEALVESEDALSGHTELDVVNDDSRKGSAAQTLEKLWNEQWTEISPHEVLQLEAVVERRWRQVARILKGVFEDLPAPWQHYNTGLVRERISSAIPSVGRVELISADGSRVWPVGTAFVVGRNLLMTNRHVAELFPQGRGARRERLVFQPGTAGAGVLHFGREHGTDLANVDGVLQFSAVRMIHPWWDMALLEVEDMPAKMPVLELSVLMPAELVGREVATLGYPIKGNDRRREAVELERNVFGGVYGVKRLAPGRICGRAATPSFGREVAAMAHDSSTLGGNSGSPVLDVTTGHVVGLHFQGRTLYANYSVPLYELARDRHVLEAGLKFAGSVSVADSWEACWRACNS